MKKLSVSFLSLLLVLVFLFSFVSCAISVEAEELSSKYTQKTQGTYTVDDAFLKAFSQFSFELFQNTIPKEPTNFLVSPLSAILCLAMIANGTDGNSKAEMENVFGMTIEELNQNLYAFTSSLYTAEDCKVNIADSIWYKNENSLVIREEFLQTNADWYQAQIYKAPFDENTLKDINNWCNKYTDGMIKKIIKEIPDSTVMYLINALCFDAKWAEKYTTDNIYEGSFTNYNKTIADVDMLNSSEHFYLEMENAIGFAKNYIGDKYSFVALLPNEKVDVYDFAKSITGDEWLKTWKNVSRKTVNVTMPEFTYDCSIPLKEALQAMGMQDIFTENADFSKMSPNLLYCSNVQQKTFIEVSRNGTKAAAVTWGNMKDTAYEPPLSIVLDRPFFYAIVDNTTGIPLFTGIVSNLSK